MAGDPTTTTASAQRIGAVTFAKLFPNPSEPFRGAFVADQVRATRPWVDWEVIAPVPLVPRVVADALGKPYASGERDFDGVRVRYTRYPVLPRRLLYATVPSAIAWTSRRAFESACEAVSARLVHAHDLFPSGAAARRLCQRAGLPYVLTVHGSDLYTNLENPRWRAEIQAAADGAAAIVCVGSVLARDCATHLGADPSRTLVIPNTYDTSRYRLVVREPHTGSLRLLSVGRLSPEKGHEVLLRAFAQLVGQGRDLSLTLVGDGAERARLEALADSLGIRERVEFTGVLVGEKLAVRMADADLFVLPSLEEGFGVVLVEAMATGLPAVATRSGGPADLVAEESSVLVAPASPEALADGVAMALDCLDVYSPERIAAAARERFSPEAIAPRLVRLYRELLGDSPFTGAFAEEARS